ILDRGRSFDVDAAKGKLVAWTWGEGPVVLLVHGWNGRGSQLAALVDPLTRAGFQVVTFDAPGHGESAGTEASLLDFADAALAMTDAVRPAFGPLQAIVAHSMGAAGVTYAMSQRLSAAAAGLERGLRDSNLPSKKFVFIAPPVDVRHFVHAFSEHMALGRRGEAALTRRLEARFGVQLQDIYAPALARDLRAPLLILHDEDDR